MKSTLFTASLLLTAALGATNSFASVSHAGSALQNTHGTLTREAVRADYFAAKQMGILPPAGERDAVQVALNSTRTLTRDMVLAEYFAAKQMGILPPSGERYTELAIANSPSTLTREAVRAEYLAAQKNGTLLPVSESW